MKGVQISSPAGFTLAEIMVVIAIIGLLTAIAIPNLVSVRASAQAEAGSNNLCKIDAVTFPFARENNKKAGVPIAYPGDLTSYSGLSLGCGLRGCPAGGIYTESVVATPPTCSLSNLATAPRLLP